MVSAAADYAAVLAISSALREQLHEAPDKIREQAKKWPGGMNNAWETGRLSCELRTATRDLDVLHERIGRLHVAAHHEECAIRRALERWLEVCGLALVRRGTSEAIEGEQRAELLRDAAAAIKGAM